MPNYQFVINSSFDPMSFKDRISPFLIAKQAYDKQEQEYLDKQDKIDKYSFLEGYNDDSEAKQLYQGYVDEYNKSFDDFNKHGLSIGNRRSWLNVRRKYQQNIGRLEDADTAMQEEIKRRQTLDAQDPSRIYATDTVNLSLDNFLNRKKPNNYSVSGQKLYERGLQIGATGSSRIYSDPQVNTLTKYYQDLVQTQGYSPKLLAEFSQRLDAIPEFQREVEQTLKEFRVDSNLTGNAYAVAKQSVVNGILNGSIYKRSDSPQQNPGVLTAAQEASNARAIDSMNMQAALHRMIRDNKAPNGWKYDVNADTSIQKYKQTQQLAQSGNSLKNGKNNSNKEVSGNFTKVKLRTGNGITKNGEISASTIPNKLKEITYDEAKKIVGNEVDKYNPGYMQYYRFYRSNNTVYPEPKEPYLYVPNQGIETGTETDDNENQY